MKNVEEELLKARNDCKRFQANFEGLIHEMVAEVDALMEIAASGSKEKQKVTLDWRSIKFTLKFLHVHCIDCDKNVKFPRSTANHLLLLQTIASCKGTSNGPSTALQEIKVMIYPHDFWQKCNDPIQPPPPPFK